MVHLWRAKKRLSSLFVVVAIALAVTLASLVACFCLCVCVCVCAGEGARGRGGRGHGWREGVGRKVRGAAVAGVHDDGRVDEGGWSLHG